MGEKMTIDLKPEQERIVQAEIAAAAFAIQKKCSITPWPHYKKRSALAKRARPGRTWRNS